MRHISIISAVLFIIISCGKEEVDPNLVFFQFSNYPDEPDGALLADDSLISYTYQFANKTSQQNEYVAAINDTSIAQIENHDAQKKIITIRTVQQGKAQLQILDSNQNTVISSIVIEVRSFDHFELRSPDYYFEEVLDLNVQPNDTAYIFRQNDNVVLDILLKDKERNTLIAEPKYFLQENQLNSKVLLKVAGIPQIIVNAQSAETVLSNLDLKKGNISSTFTITVIDQDEIDKTNFGVSGLQVFPQPKNRYLLVGVARRSSGEPVLGTHFTWSVLDEEVIKLSAKEQPSVTAEVLDKIGERTVKVEIPPDSDNYKATKKLDVNDSISCQSQAAPNLLIMLLFIAGFFFFYKRNIRSNE